MAEPTPAQLESPACCSDGASPSEGQGGQYCDTTASATPLPAPADGSGQSPREAGSPAGCPREAPGAGAPLLQSPPRAAARGRQRPATASAATQDRGAAARSQSQRPVASTAPLAAAAGEAGGSSPGNQSGNSEERNAVADSEEEASDGGEAGRDDMNAWLYDVLQRVQPGASITVNSLHLLENLFDKLVSRVLNEAQACATEPAAGGGPSRKRKPETLTSLQIQKAMRRVLPGEPGDLLRPYLPTETKLARHLDKQSLRGLRTKRTPAGDDDS